MKTTFIPLTRVLGTAAVTAVCLLALPQTSQARDHGTRQSSSMDNNTQQYYSSQPRSSFTLSLGTGYAGTGYYYGPPNSPFYYAGPGVRYYSTRDAVPREYYSHEGYRHTSSEVAVQSALSRNGYYRGPIDGDIGPMSRHAIAHYQQDHGLRVTGYINSSLLHSLGL